MRVALASSGGALVFVLALGLSACSLFLDFDLSGGDASAPLSDAAALDAVRPPAGGDATDEAGPPLLPLNCQEFDVCDGFEGRPNVVGGPFDRIFGEGLSLTQDRRRVASELQSLEVIRPPSTGILEQAFVASEGNTDGWSGNIRVEVYIALDVDITKLTGERSLVLVVPSGRINDPVNDGARIVVRSTGIFGELRVYDTPPALFASVPIETARLADGRYHRVALIVRFDDTRGGLAVEVDNQTLPGVADVDAVETTLGPAVSFGVGASAAAGATAPALTARFDNLRVRLR
jgi:hypothetical protein